MCNLCSVWCMLPSYMLLMFPLLLELFLVAKSDDLPPLGLVPDCCLSHMGCGLSSVLSQESVHMGVRAECWLLLDFPFGLSSPRICHLHPSLPLSSEHPGADSL